MKAIIYHLTLQEPAILTALEGEPNSSVSYDFIPGAVMRGVLIGAFMRNERVQNLNLAEPTVERRLFFSDQVRFLNAYPAINGKRSLPVPGSWRKRKYSETDTDLDRVSVYDYAMSDRSSADKMKNVKGFVHYVPKTGIATRYRSQRILNIHTQRARRRAAEQQVYRYDALAPGQTFAGVILCDDADDAARVQTTLESLDRFYLGGARSAGYGLALLEYVDLIPHWAEVEHDPDHAPDSPLILTLLSDVILRDEHGQYTTHPDALKRYGITFKDDGFIALKTTLVGGFNRKWGLPLPQTPALERGSVIELINVDGDFDQLINQGIGERRNEGFGRIALNWQCDSEIELETLKVGEPIDDEDSPLSDESRELWHRFEARINVEQVDANVYTEKRFRVTGQISPSQLARLRVKIADALCQPEPSCQCIIDFLDDIHGIVAEEQESTEEQKTTRKQKAAGKQFDNAVIEQSTLTEWLRKKAETNTRYQLQFIDAVLDRAHKERTQQEAK